MNSAPRSPGTYMNPFQEEPQTSWDADPVENVSSCRAQICLNGPWQIFPLSPCEPDIVFDPATLGSVQFPASWPNIISWATMPTLQLLTPGSSPAFGRFDPQSPGPLIYRRQLQIPKSWDGRAIFVEMHRDILDAEVRVQTFSMVYNWETLQLGHFSV